GPMRRRPPSKSLCHSWIVLPVAAAALCGRLFVDLSLGCTAAPLGVARDADRDEQRYAVKHRLDPERAAELLNARDADRKDRNADHRAPHVDTPGRDRR